MRRDPTEFRKRFAKWKETGEYSLPRFAEVTEGWKDTEQQKAVQEWGEDWKTRATAAGGSKVVQKWSATGKRPKPESSSEYTKRRSQEETKRTWLSNAADVAEGVKEAALSMTPYTAVPYFGAKVGQAVLNGNVGAGTALDAAFAAAPFMPKMTIPGLRQLNKIVDDAAYNSLRRFGVDARLANDITVRPLDVIDARLHGNLPLTFKERRSFIEKLHKEEQEVMQRGSEYERIQRQKRAELIRDARYPEIEDVSTFIQYPKWVGPAAFTKIGRKKALGNYTRANSGYEKGHHIINIPIRDQFKFTFIPDKNYKHLLQHEFTHNLQRDRAYSPFLSLSSKQPYNEYGGYFIPELDVLKGVSDHPFTIFEDAANVQRRATEDAIIAGQPVPRLFRHSMSPDEAVADLRADILENGKIDYNYFNREYGLSTKDIDWMINNGY